MHLGGRPRWSRCQGLTKLLYDDPAKYMTEAGDCPRVTRWKILIASKNRKLTQFCVPPGVIGPHWSSARAEYLAQRIAKILRQDGPSLFVGSRANVLSELMLEKDISNAKYNGTDRRDAHHAVRACQFASNCDPPFASNNDPPDCCFFGGLST